MTKTIKDILDELVNINNAIDQLKSESDRLMDDRRYANIIDILENYKAVLLGHTVDF